MVLLGRWGVYRARGMTSGGNRCQGILRNITEGSVSALVPNKKFVFSFDKYRFWSLS
jgi:hypothetical protein